jgi:hypothetical protein
MTLPQPGEGHLQRSAVILARVLGFIETFDLARPELHNRIQHWEHKHKNRRFGKELLGNIGELCMTKCLNKRSGY